MGPRAEAEELVWRFRELSDEHGGRVVFYQSSVECLPAVCWIWALPHEDRRGGTGTAGELFTGGSIRAELRTARRAGERDRATFEVVPAAEVPKILPPCVPFRTRG